VNSPEEPARGRPRGILANTLFGLLAQGTTAVFTTVLTLYLVRALGPDAYGLFTLALSIAAVGILVSDFGLASSVGRYVAEGHDDLPSVRQVTDIGLRLKLVGAFGVGGALFLLAPLIADLYGKQALVDPLRLVGVSLVFESMLMLYTSTFGALRRVVLNARTIFLESLVETLASIGLVVGGGGVAGAAGGRAIGYAAGALIGASLLARIVGRPRLRRDPADAGVTRAIKSYARPLLVINGAYTLYSYIDALLIGLLLTARDVGEFTAPLRLITLVGYVGQSVATAVSPRLAGDRPDLASFSRALRWMIILQAFLIVPMAAWSEPIVNLLLGPKYRLAGDVLLALVPYAFLYGLGPLIAMTVTYAGHARQRVPIVLFSLGVNLVIDLVLLPTIGVLGAAVGTGIGFAIYVPAHLRVFITDFHTDVRPIVRTLLRALVSAALAVGALLAIGHRDLAVWQWAAGIVAAPTVFVAALMATGEISRAELRAVATRFRRG
jgi:O-antigen/teichoic acid export membrane protein